MLCEQRLQENKQDYIYLICEPVIINNNNNNDAQGKTPNICFERLFSLAMMRVWIYPPLEGRLYPRLSCVA